VTPDKITVITVSYNSAATISSTLRSISEQAHPNIEHIVIDGGSSDETIALVRELGSRVVTLVSESDRGIYDAMNKGLRLATGEVIGFINSDDFLASPDVIAKVARVFSDPSIDACYGDLCYVKPDDVASVVRYWRSSAFSPGLFLHGWCPPHPTLYVRRRVYELFGDFDLRYRIAADAELMMRFLEVHRINALYIPEVLVHMRIGGTTNRSVGNIMRQNLEIWRALKDHGLRPSVGSFVAGKLLSRGKQFLTRPM
jgi:glycosyltransferase involved in cell wall biosynthesis